MPVNDLEIWRTAKTLIDAHGENASLEAAQRADWAIQDGNPEAESVWMRVLKALEALQRAQRSTSRYPNESIQRQIRNQFNRS